MGVVRFGVAAGVAVIVAAGLVVGGAGVHADPVVVGPGTEIRIHRSDREGPGGCTLGPVLSTTQALTAGHCGEAGNIVTTSGGLFIGTIVKSAHPDLIVIRNPDGSEVGGTYGDRSDIPDYAVIDTSLSWVPISQTINGATPDWSAIATRKQLAPLSTENGGDGSRVCMTGMVSHRICGPIQLVGTTIPYIGVFYDTDSHPGDSGSPVYFADGSGTKIRYIGIHTTEDGGTTMLSEALRDCGALCRPDTAVAASIDQRLSPPSPPADQAGRGHGQSLWQRLISVFTR